MENKTIMHRIYEELFNNGNLSMIDELFDKNFADRNLAAVMSQTICSA